MKQIIDMPDREFKVVVINTITVLEKIAKGLSETSNKGKEI